MTDVVKLEKPALILRGCGERHISSHGFCWPEKGHAECFDWSPEPCCGGGLHGFLWGEGNSSLLTGPNYIVAEIMEYIDLDGKVKFPECEVVLSTTDIKKATEYIAEYAPKEARIMHRHVSLPNGNGFVGGNRCIVIGLQDVRVDVDDDCIVRLGDFAKVKAGLHSIIDVGIGSNVTVSRESMVTSTQEARVVSHGNCILRLGINSSFSIDHPQTVVVIDGKRLATHRFLPNVMYTATKKGIFQIDDEGLFTKLPPYTKPNKTHTKEM